MNKKFFKYSMIATTITYAALFIDLNYGIATHENRKVSNETSNKVSASALNIKEKEGNPELLSEGAYFTPCLNNDGTRLLYSSGDNIYIMNLQDKSIEQLTSMGNCYNPAYYEKDNNIVAFARNDGIYKLDLKTKKITKIVTSAEPEVSFAKPNFTPEGDLIYFKVTVLPRPEGHGFIEKEPSIVKISNDGSGQEKIIEGYNPVLSKDGKKLLYELNNNIYMMNLETKDSRIIDEGKYAAWSNSGKSISYAKFDRSAVPYSKTSKKKKLFIDKEYSNIYIADINNVKKKKKITKEEFENKEEDIKSWLQTIEDSTSEQHFLVVSKIAFFDSTWSADDKELLVSTYNSDKEAFELLKYKAEQK